MFRQCWILLFTILFAAFPVFCQFDLIKTKPTPKPTAQPASSADNDENNKSPEKSDKDSDKSSELSNEIITYTGETFGICSIAYSFDISCEKLANYNGLSYQSKLPPATKIRVPVTPKMQEDLKKLADSKLKSGFHFKMGLFNLQDNRRSQAGEDFNNSIEMFLMSKININRNLETLKCYNAMVETIYQIEFPALNQIPQIRSLASICEWNWNENDYKLADAVARIISFGGKVATNSNDAKPNNANNQSAGFNEQKFEVSPFDELAKLELIPEESEKILQPRSQLQPTRPQLQPITVKVDTVIRVVTAKSGDTVAKLAVREGLSAFEIAKYNGLLPTSILSAGRVIKIPPKASAKVKSSIQAVLVNQVDSDKILGSKPAQAKDGKVSVVLDYLNEILNDPYSMRFVRWSQITETDYGGIPCWRVQVKYRAKNLMGAYVLSEDVFYIRKNKVIKAIRLN